MKNFKKVAGLSLAMVMVISASGSALAATSQEGFKLTNPISNTESITKSKKAEFRADKKVDFLLRYKEKLDAKVSKAKITQVEADALYATAESGDWNKVFGQCKDFENKELTDEKKATLLATYKEKLDAKVTAATITQVEADALYAAAVAGDYSAIFQKPELTDEQKATLLATYKEKLDIKVKAATITQVEADKLYAAAVAGDYSKFLGLGHHGPECDMTDDNKLDTAQ